MGATLVDFVDAAATEPEGEEALADAAGGLDPPLAVGALSIGKLLTGYW
jgi:hypothetical protein